MNASKINKNVLRRKMATKDIFTFAELARRIDCTETSIHGAIDKPSRFGVVTANIIKLVGAKNLSELTSETATHKAELAHV